MITNAYCMNTNNKYTHLSHLTEFKWVITKWVLNNIDSQFQKHLLCIWKTKVTPLNVSKWFYVVVSALIKRSWTRISQRRISWNRAIKLKYRPTRTLDVFQRHDNLTRGLSRISATQTCTDNEHYQLYLIRFLFWVSIYCYSEGTVKLINGNINPHLNIYSSNGFTQSSV